MRTTANLHDEALALCKKKAEELNTTLGEVISRAVFEAYRDRPTTQPRRAWDLPVSGRGGLQAGVDLDSMASLEDLMSGHTK